MEHTLLLRSPGLLGRGGAERTVPGLLLGLALLGDRHHVVQDATVAVGR